MAIGLVLRSMAIAIERMAQSGRMPMPDQRELKLTGSEAAFTPSAAPRLWQRLLDLSGYSALRSLGGRKPETRMPQGWDGLEPFDLLRGWQCGED